jgi:hypothetical protein
LKGSLKLHSFRLGGGFDGATFAGGYNQEGAEDGGVE